MSIVERFFWLADALSDIAVGGLFRYWLTTGEPLWKDAFYAIGGSALLYFGARKLCDPDWRP